MRIYEAVQKDYEIVGKYVHNRGNMSILEIGPVIFGNIDNLIQFLQQKQLLASNVICSNCNTPMTLSTRSDL